MARKIKLTSKCNVKGSEGMPGETVLIKDDKLADQIIASRGGVEVTATESDKGDSKKV